MSHSLKVVRMAAVCCAITSWVAILRRRGESFLRVERLSLGAETVAWGGRGAGEGAGAETCGGAAGAGAGGFCGVAAGLAAAGFSGSGAGAAATDAGSISATACPILTSSPSATFVWTMPVAGALTSCETLSVSRVKRTSPSRTVSPFLRCQMVRTPDVMDSPTAGILTSVFMRGWFRLRRPV